LKTEDKARVFFDKKMTDRERAIFEGAIGLSSIFHQYMGTPICNRKETIKQLEEAIQNTTLIQPYKKEIKVKLNIGEDFKKEGEYNYRSLEGRDFDVTLVTEYGESRVTSRMRYVPEMDYVLMYVDKIEKKKT